jgi:Rps23 Pro-64 3,4-dihydroxylase Tpa1-like proline 4-hydroxylase
MWPVTGASLADGIAARLDAFGQEEPTRKALALLQHAREEAGSQAAQADFGAWWRHPAPMVLCDEFLGPRELASLRAFVASIREQFAPATLVRGDSAETYIDTSYRLSQTVFNLGPLAGLFQERVARYLDFASGRLELPSFSHPRFELQLTATPTGGFFREHDDSSHANNRSRRLTFVYYFFMASHRWSGGALRFAPTPLRPYPVDVLPLENRLVFFDSAIRHEVLPYTSEWDTLEGSRFTVNGWVHQDSWS